MKETQKAASDKDLTPADQTRLLEEAQSATDNYLEAFEKGITKYAQSADPLVAKLFQAIEAQDMTVEIETIMTLPANMQKIFEMIRAAADGYFKRVPLEIKLFAAQKGLPTDTPKEIDEVLKQYNETLLEQAEAANTAKVAQSDLDNELLKLQATIEGFKDATTVSLEPLEKGTLREKFLPSGTKEFINALTEIDVGLKKGFSIEGVESITKHLEKAADGGFSTAAALNAFNDAVIETARLQKTVSEAAPVGKELELSNELAGARESHRLYLESVVEAEIQQLKVGAAIDGNKAKTDAAVQSQKALTQATTENAQAVTDAPTKVQETNQEATQLKTTQAGITGEVGNTNSGLSQMKSEIAGVNSEATNLLGTLSSITASVRTVGTTVNNPHAEFKALGGPLSYFANGGQGTDVINAQLSKGETVTNARSSRRFFSQLQAMNAGQNPVFRSEGGDTYNTNVGDINVSGGGNPQQAAREVMKAIRREERRGSGR